MSDVLKDLKDSKSDFLSLHSTIKEKYKVDDKTQAEIEKEFSLEIPHAPDLETCRQLLARTAELFQTASFMLARAETTHTLLAVIYKKQYSQALLECRNKFIREDGKAPAKEVVEAAADEVTAARAGALSHAEIAIHTAKRLVDLTTFNRKVLEDIVISLGTEAKMLSHS